MIYLVLQGRIGNQLFMYAFAKAVQEKLGKDTKIVIDDSRVLEQNWVNSLYDYNLKNIEFISEKNAIYKYLNFAQKIIFRLYEKKYMYSNEYIKKYKYEKKWQRLWNKFGMIICENGYIEHKISSKASKHIFLIGYFQSEKYFKESESTIRKELYIGDKIEQKEYPNLNALKERNSVCISIKVEHNIGSELYDVCTKEYWEKAVKYICAHVENPLFFICSDNVQYVMKHIIDCSKYDVVVQDKNFKVSESLAAMAECKHFIIGNTTYGWWAQYLSKNEDKIVIAPSRWMLVDMPIDIYQEDWVLI